MPRRSKRAAQSGYTWLSVCAVRTFYDESIFCKIGRRTPCTRMICSVGIDIGTSTTQLIFSRLTIENRASSYTVPRIEHCGKRGRSTAATFTLRRCVRPRRSTRRRSRKSCGRSTPAAGMTPDDVRTGAVIITGETARKQNANEVLEALSDLAGDFVVATAGPDLESVLSARGAGTDKPFRGDAHGRRQSGCRRRDRATSPSMRRACCGRTCCLDIGGRLIKVEDGRITYIFPQDPGAGQRATASRCAVGDRGRSASSSAAVCGLMADQLAQALRLAAGGRATTPDFIPTTASLCPKQPAMRGGDLLRRRGGLHLSADGGRRVSLRRHRRPAWTGHSGQPGSQPGAALYRPSRPSGPPWSARGRIPPRSAAAPSTMRGARCPSKMSPFLRCPRRTRRRWKRCKASILHQMPLYHAGGESGTDCHRFHRQRSAPASRTSRALAAAIIESAKEVISRQVSLDPGGGDRYRQGARKRAQRAARLEKDVICIDGITHPERRLRGYRRAGRRRACAARSDQDLDLQFLTLRLRRGET